MKTPNRNLLLAMRTEAYGFLDQLSIAFSITARDKKNTKDTN